MAAIAPAVQNLNSSSYANGERACVEKLNEVKKEDMSNDDDVPLSRKVRMIIDDDDIPLAKKLKTMQQDDDDVPLSQKAKLQKGLSEGALAASSSNRVKKPHSSTKKVVKTELESDDDVPLSVRAATLTKKRRKNESDDEDYKLEKKKEKGKNSSERKKASTSSSSEKVHIKNEKANGITANKRKKREEEEEEIWKWWEEEKKPSGIKWYSLSHKGPIFAPPYVLLPESVHFKYDGKVMKLAPLTEEVASFYAKILDHEYTTKETFNKNFFMDWRKVMTPAEREKITDLTKCDFREMHAYYVKLREERRSLSKEEKQKMKEIKQEEAKIYGVAYIDGHKQKIGNFRIEPPDLFRGRGGHPKMGRLKRRINPEDVIINCSKILIVIFGYLIRYRDSEIPKPPEGHRWKEVRHDNTVTWLCSWTENILGSIKYIMLNPSSKIKGEKDYEKFETARRLKGIVGSIRENYTKDLKSKEMRLALRAGNEKDVDEAADTVGCCSLRCEHIELHEKLDDNDYVVEFDFLGKDSIRYYNKVPVEKRVFKNLKLFMENKSGNDDLFDRLDTASLNKYLQSLMPGLTAKVFRTYNASITLQQQLEKLTKDDSTPPELLLCYNRANRQVAILCNHQRAVPKSHEKSMENLETKIKTKKAELKEAKEELEKARGDAAKQRASKRIDRIREQLRKLKIQRTDKDENKQIALSTSKLNYLDPRISVAWCKKYQVPVEKIFNKTQREKFRWAIDMADEDYVF
uniref:DNA topoisomerase I n=1 Tax=Onchocerca volvulus TaxID=6282 RepID=A0A8R1XQI3_ONCVO